jgi:putative flippase GtrA
MTFVRYVAIQLLAYGIDMGLFLIVLYLELSGPIMANVLAKIVAGIFAFVAHRSFTFRVSENPAIRQQAIRYFVLLAVNIPVASAILALLLVWIAEPFAAKFVADIACIALTYGLSKHYIFTGRQECSERKNCTGADV